MELRTVVEIRLGPLLKAPARLAGKAERIVLALVVPALVSALVHAIFTREPWYDEFYTLYVTQPALGWSEALTRHWLADNHPPLFYALARATTWLGDSLEARRLLNLAIALAALVAGIAIIRHDAGDGGVRRATVYFLFLASQGAAFPLVAELRSYFLSYCAVAVLVLAVVTLWTKPFALPRGGTIALWLAALVSFNAHIVTSIVAGSLLLPFMAVAVVRCDLARVRAIAFPIGVAGVTFLTAVAVQFHLWIANTGAFWIPADPSQVVHAVAMVWRYAAAGNLPLFWGGILGLGLLIVRAIGEKRVPRSLESALLLLAGVALAGAVLTALHAWRALVIPKYLIGLFPPIGMAAAIGLGGLMARLGQRAGALLLAIVAVLCLVAIGRNAAAVSRSGGWDRPAREVARQVAVCPGAVVHAEMRWNAHLAGLQPRDNAQVVPYAYGLVAKRNGFVIEPPSSRHLSMACPTLFWGQVAGEDMPDAATLLAHERGRGFRLDRLYLYRVGGGWIASDRRLRIAQRAD